MKRSQMQVTQSGWPICPECEEDELARDLLLCGPQEPKASLENCLNGSFYCYNCGWRGTFEDDIKLPEPESALGRAVRIARGGPAPIPFRGF